MKSKPGSSGLDELMRLSQRTAKEAKDLDQKEKQRAKQRQVVQDVVKGLRDISITVSLQQLKTLASPDIVREVSSLKHKEGTEDLRKLISRLANDLEKRMSRVSVSKPEMVPISKEVKTLVILLELLFSLK